MQALRLIKFAVGKAGVEFRREIQRQAPVVRNLLHYRLGIVLCLRNCRPIDLHESGL